MYKIENNGGYLLVKFEEDFDYNTVSVIIRHVTMMKEYPSTNDLWMVGKHRAHIRLGELESMVREFHCHCPQDATRTKTAIVAKQGLTQSILELWVNAVRKKVSFDLQIFHALEEAEEWLGVAEPKVA